MEVNPKKSFLLFSDLAKYLGQVDILLGCKLKKRKKKVGTHQTSLPEAPHSPF